MKINLIMSLALSGIVAANETIVIDETGKPIMGVTLFKVENKNRFFTPGNLDIFSESDRDGKIKTPDTVKGDGFLLWEKNHACNFISLPFRSSSIVLNKIKPEIIKCYDQESQPQKNARITLSQIPVMFDHSIEPDKEWLPSGSQKGAIYSGVSDDNGIAKIYGVPKGKYLIQGWHNYKIAVSGLEESELHDTGINRAREFKFSSVYAGIVNVKVADDYILGDIFYNTDNNGDVNNWQTIYPLAHLQNFLRNRFEGSYVFISNSGGNFSVGFIFSKRGWATSPVYLKPLSGEPNPIELDINCFGEKKATGFIKMGLKGFVGKTNVPLSDLFIRNIEWPGFVMLPIQVGTKVELPIGKYLIFPRKRSVAYENIEEKAFSLEPDKLAEMEINTKKIMRFCNFHMRTPFNGPLPMFRFNFVDATGFKWGLGNWNRDPVGFLFSIGETTIIPQCYGYNEEKFFILVPDYKKNPCPMLNYTLNLKIN